MTHHAGSGTKADPWVLKTPPGTSDYTMYRDETSDPPSIVCQVGGTQLRYDLRAIDDLHAMLKANGGWVPLGAADEQKPAAEGTVEAWGRAGNNPVKSSDTRRIKVARSVSAEGSIPSRSRRASTKASIGLRSRDASLGAGT